MKHYLLFVTLLLATMCFAVTAQAEQTPPWLQPEVVKAYVDIGLTDEQKPMFQKALIDYLQKSNRAIQSAINNNKGNLEREIRRRFKKQTKRWSKNAAEFLTEEQYPKFEVYRDTLVASMSKR